MRRGEIVNSPDGDRWRVRRRWMNRPLPTLRGRWGRQDGETAVKRGMDVVSIDPTESILATIAGFVLVVLIVFVFFPLIGVAFELALVFLVLSSGILGRVVLRQPWIVEAANLDHPDRSTAFAVKGWRRSGEAIEALTQAIPATGLPSHLSEAKAVPGPSAR
jgi:hypothetical protein